MGCCGSGGGGGYQPAWGGTGVAPAGTRVWRHELPEGDTFEDGSAHRDFVTWVEADASRAQVGKGTYYEHYVTESV